MVVSLTPSLRALSAKAVVQAEKSSDADTENALSNDKAATHRFPLLIKPIV